MYVRHGRKAVSHVLLRKMQSRQRLGGRTLKDLLPEIEAIETQMNVTVDEFSIRISVGPASVSLSASNDLALVRTVFAINDLG